MAKRLSMISDFPAVRSIRSEPVIEPEPIPYEIPKPWYNDLSHDITDSTVFRWILIIVVFDYIWRWMRG